ncbi:HD domain-containing protein [Patescibacteria group bacterium AH-259-L07]|nr:HD domain-containing protein [Patescibacteria group bacterium AH-259-L07]
MDSVEIIKKYYKENSKSYYFLTEHSKAVTEKALKIAHNVGHLNPDLEFIEQAAMLHDIGIFLTNAPEIGCFGERPYICHGYLGRKILEKEALPKHALVCERHTGVGLSIQDIEKEKLPIPKRDMRPISLEEEIICFADTFFSKNEEFLTKEKSIEEIRKGLMKFVGNKVKVFDAWVKKFG